MAQNGFDIIMVGHRGHVEVEGTMGHAPDRIHLVERKEDVATLEIPDPDRLGVVTQTTLSVDDTSAIMAALKARFPNISLPRNDDICYATQNRQDAVKRLTDEADVIIVVGAPESSNSNRLAELAARRGARAYMVQTAEEIDPDWLAGAACVGVTSGASAPEVLVTEVIDRIAELSGATTPPRSLPEFDEGMVFKLPPSLR
jgi:4-hydroxy-3-methylbut-2-enyl diphosphate reductase